MFLLMLAQAAGTLLREEPLAPIVFDLRNVVPAPNANEIVVTAPRDERLPLAEAAEELMLPRAETGLIGNLRGAVVADQHQLPGANSNRVMVKLKLPF